MTLISAAVETQDGSPLGWIRQHQANASWAQGCTAKGSDVHPFPGPNGVAIHEHVGTLAVLQDPPSEVLRRQESLEGARCTRTTALVTKPACEQPRRTYRTLAALLAAVILVNQVNCSQPCAFLECQPFQKLPIEEQLPASQGAIHKALPQLLPRRSAKDLLDAEIEEGRPHQLRLLSEAIVPTLPITALPKGRQHARPPARELFGRSHVPVAALQLPLARAEPSPNSLLLLQGDLGGLHGTTVHENILST